MTTPSNVAPSVPFGLARFDAYAVALRFYREVVVAVRDLRGNVVDHLLASAESVVLNVAEGHPTIGADRARKFRIAGGEAAECQAALISSRSRARSPRPRSLAQLRPLLDRELAMLFKLGRRRR